MQSQGASSQQPSTRREKDCKAFGLPNYSKRSITISPKGKIFLSDYTDYTGLLPEDLHVPICITHGLNGATPGLNKKRMLRFLFQQRLLQPLKWSKFKIVDFDSVSTEEKETDSVEFSKGVESDTQPMISDSDSTDDESYPNFNRKLLTRN